MSATRDVVVVDAARCDPDERAAIVRLRDLMTKVDRDKPDALALQELRGLMDTVPHLGRILCDLVEVNADKVIATIVSGVSATEAVRRNARAMRDDMGYKIAPELERALIDHAIMCWLRLQKIELTYSQVMAESITIERAAYWERRLTTVQGRYLRAAESLARVRRLSRSTSFQVNIGGRQVNVATGPAIATSDSSV